jgi:uncharacterized protein YaaN involved in tellurite resistance
MEKQTQALKLDDAASIMNDLHLLNAGDIKATAGDDPKLDAQAEQLAATLVNFDTKDQTRVNDIRSAVENMGYQVQTQAAKQSDMLKRPVKEMMSRSEDGQSVGKALIDLKMTVEDLDPATVDLSAGFVSRTMGYLPFIGTPLKRYFSKFESSQTVINSIISSLEKGRDQLNRDNITLTEDQKRMRQMTLKLEQSVKLGQLLDQKISYKLERDIPQDDPRHKFIQEEILFALRQRIMDLQQQLAVNQQGVLATEIVIRNNKELIRGVNRALNVTVNALQVAVTVALALENQKIVLDKVNALSKTTDTLIANTAARLRTQGAEIHKQASSSSLSIESLKQAFVDINAAMDDIATYRANALPQMAKSILEMDGLAAKAEESIRKMEKAKLAAPAIQIEVL